MAKTDYIEYSKRERYNEQLEFLQKFNLTSHNLKRFEDKIDAIVTSIDTEIRSSMAYVDDIQGVIDEASSKPEIKALVDDPWYKISSQQKNLIKYLIRAGAFKTWLIKFLVVSNNKLGEFLDNINESLVELKKVEMQADMYKQMYQSLEEIRKGQAQHQDYFAQKEYEQQISSLKEQIASQQGKMADMTYQLTTFTNLINDLDKKNKMISSEVDAAAAATAAAATAEVVNNNVSSNIEVDDSEEDQIYDEETDETDDEDYEEDDDEDNTDDDSNDEEEDDGGGGSIKKKEVGIEFDDFDEELKFYKEFTQDLNFKPDTKGMIQFILETAEDIERELGVNRANYKKRKDRVNMLGQMAFTYNDYVYNREALLEFFSINKAKLTWAMKSAGVEDRLLIEG